MNIIKREFRANIFPLLIWVASLSFIMFGASIEFSVFQGDAAIQEAMDQFDVIFQALGSTVADMTTAIGFIGILSVYIYLPLAIYSGLLGSGIISKEEKDKTAEYLFTLPVSINKVIASKIVVAIINTVLINVLLILMIFLIFSRFGVDGAFVRFMVNLSLGVLGTQLIFMAVGMVLSSVLKQYKQSGSLTIGIMISTFFIHILIGFVEEVDFLKYITPFQYFQASDMTNGNFYLSFVLITIGIVISGIGSTLFFYQKRDLYI